MSGDVHEKGLDHDIEEIDLEIKIRYEVILDVSLTDEKFIIFIRQTRLNFF